MRVAILFLIFFPNLSVAQGLTQVQLTVYNASNGGPTGLVNCIFQSSSGYLWFGCSNGLVRHDGYSFSSYPNSNGFPQNVTHIAEDKEGNLWLSFPEGRLATFSPITGKFINYHLPADGDTALATIQITTIFLDRHNRLWLGTGQKGLVQYNAEKNKAVIYPLNDLHHEHYAPFLRKVYNTVYAIREDDRGVLWLATHDGLYLLNNSSVQPMPLRPAPVPTSGVRKDLFNDLVFVGDEVWLGAWSGGLSSYNRKTGHWQNFLPDPAAFGKGTTNIINGVATKDKNHLWLCSVDKGLGTFNLVTKQFRFFRDGNSDPRLPQTEVWGMTTDKDGNIWAIDGQQVIKLRENNNGFYFSNLPVVRTDNQQYFGVTDFWEDENLQLIATDYADGLHVRNKRSGYNSIVKVDWLANEEASQQVRQIYHDHSNRIWIISRDFIHQYDRVKQQLKKFHQPPRYSADSLTNNFLSVIQASDGRMWFATRRNGIFVWDDKSNRFLHYHNDARGNFRLPSNNVRSLATDARGRLWIAGPEHLLGYFVSATSAITTPAIRQTSSQYSAHFLHADVNGNIWAATNSGAVYFECGGNDPSIKKIINGSNGLPTDIVYNLTTDKNGNLWCLSDAGLSYVPNNGVGIKTFSHTDGIQKGTGTKVLPSASDTMLLLNYGGYYKFLPSQILKTDSISPLKITAMHVNGSPYSFNDALANGKIVKLSASQNRFSFEFAALNYRHPEKQRYAYMLEGFDKDWITSGGRRFVSYTNVPGGNYTFKVKTLEPSKDGRENIITIALTVATPFYRTLLFYSLVALVFAITLYGIHRNRLAQHNRLFILENKAQHLEKEKALVMYDSLKQQLNPHFLFNSLTSLSSLITKDPSAARNYLEGLSSVYRYILKNRDSELVTLERELVFAQTYIDLQKTRFKEALQVNITVREQEKFSMIVPVTLQNLIENATKHNVLDREEPLTIDIFTDGDYLLVRNNLQKKKTVETSNRQGLKSMKSLYGYLTDKPMFIEENETYFTVHIPLIS